MSKIRVLPDTLINKIAAGEVVERPASVIKELLENSLDAGAKRVGVAIENGGRKLLRVSDDGCGMSRDDAILAFERHATSKIKTTEDLENIVTLGFRGEALPSIAAVAKITLDTKTPESLAGTRVEINGGRMLGVKDIAWSGGAEISVADLFFNMPARKKFLRSETTELYHISNLVTHYALANPSIAFSLSHNGRESINVTPVESLRDRAYQLFGGNFLTGVVELEFEVIEAKVTGFVSTPGHAKTSREGQYFFVNGRFVRDKVISRAVANAYKNILPSGMFPAAIIFIEAPLADVDVNAHPAKTEVRFRKANIIQDAIFNAIRAKIAEHKPVPNFPALSRQISSHQTFFPPPRQGVSALPPQASSLSFYSQEPARGADLQPARLAPLSGKEKTSAAPSEISSADEAAQTEVCAARQEESGADLQSARLALLSGQKETATAPSEISSAAETAINIESLTSETAPTEVYATTLPLILSSSTAPKDGSAMLAAEFANAAPVATLNPASIKPIGQMRDSFIIATDEEGLLLIDQHVAHERILFEQHLARYRAKQLEKQRLLLPEPIDLTPAQAAAFEQIKSELETNGFEVMQLSGRTIAVQSIPAGLPMKEARALLTDLLDAIERERSGLTLDHLRAEIAASVACKAAIKVNMPLTMEKMIWLIDELMKAQIPTNCPHGRPIILRFSLRDILRGFERI